MLSLADKLNRYYLRVSSLVLSLSGVILEMVEGNLLFRHISGLDYTYLLAPTRSLSDGRSSAMTTSRDLPSENNLGLSRSYQKNEFVLDIIILGVTIDKYSIHRGLYK